jgi:hypothetical protein
VALPEVDWKEMARLPGAELVEQGVSDLHRGRQSIAALLVCIGAPRLQSLGIAVPDPFDEPELRLYRRLTDEYGDEAHSRYNALIRRLVSFERAACVK